MVPMKSLDPETVEFIKNAPFHHYYLWRVVNKEDSISTPVRLVVVPTMSGLNLTLAKGESCIGSLIDILLWKRVLEHAWSSDVTKLYNQLHLQKSALPYSLFLYSDDLNPNSLPATFVMKVAWYGVVPTRNQANYALGLLVQETAEDFPHAVDPLSHHRYVDDEVSGAETPGLRDEQIAQSAEVLARGGLSSST